jgi:Gpi18-like mannosyltransferase
VIVSALGALAAMLALYDLTYEALGEEGGMRAVFYLLIFPTSFFFVQVYTEGLFVGLALACLAMLKRKHLVYAALLAVAATLTRAVGVALVIPMAITWIHTKDWYALDLEWDQLYFKRPPWRPIWHAFLAFTPLIVYLIWKFSYYGINFDYVEAVFFGRAPLEISKGFTYWTATFYNMIAGFSHSHALGQPNFIVPSSFSANYLIEFVFMVVGFIAILRCLKTDPEVAWFSLATFLIAWVSGPPGIHRYMLAAPAIFITLAHWGKNPVFDRAWTIVSLLLMGLLSMLFAFDFWVA